MPADRLMSIHSPLYGFNEHVVVPNGIIILHMMLGNPPRHFNLMINFMVVKVPSAYNMILGRPCIRMTKL